MSHVQVIWAANNPAHRLELIIILEEDVKSQTTLRHTWPTSVAEWWNNENLEHTHFVV